MYSRLDCGVPRRVIANSNPTLLTNLFFLYPNLKFDLFHISYPYQGELSVLAKGFPNVCCAPGSPRPPNCPRLPRSRLAAVSL
jgi:hypothetical protein